MTVAAVTSDGTGAVPDHGPDWSASLRLRFGLRQGGTRLLERVHDGPLVVQRPSYPEADGRCHVSIVHRRGGIADGDEMAMRVDVTEGGQVLLTSPAATRLHGGAGRVPTLTHHLTVSAGSTLEWLPPGIIADDGSDARIATRVILEERARYLGWDVLSLGRAATDAISARGRLSQHLEIRREDRLLLDERLVLEAGGAVQGAPWGLGHRRTLARFVAVSAGEVSSELVADVRQVLPAGLAAATRVSGALVVRALCENARDAHTLLRSVWQVTRPALLGCPPVAPRFWAT
jgi:urease accessory protein